MTPKESWRVFGRPAGPIGLKARDLDLESSSENAGETNFLVSRKRETTAAAILFWEVFSDFLKPILEVKSQETSYEQKPRDFLKLQTVHNRFHMLAVRCACHGNYLTFAPRPAVFQTAGEKICAVKVLL